jgi:hypothetical protein
LRASPNPNTAGALIFEVNVRVVVDTTTKQSAEQYRDDLMSSLPSWAEVVACEGTVKGAEMLPMTTQRDVDRKLDDLVEMARSLNRHATSMEQQVVEARVRLVRGLHRDLHRVIDEIDGRTSGA